MRVTRSSCEPLRSSQRGSWGAELPEEPWIPPSSALDLDHLHTHSLGPMAFQCCFSSLMPRHSLGGWGGWEADPNKIPRRKETVSNITDNNSSPSKKSYYWCTISCVVELKPCVLKYHFCHFLKSLWRKKWGEWPQIKRGQIISTLHFLTHHFGGAPFIHRCNPRSLPTVFSDREWALIVTHNETSNIQVRI